MPILYPGALDALTNPTASDTLAGVPHDAQHANANDAIEALQTKLGIGASTAATIGHVLRVSGSGATAYAAIQDGDLPATIARDSEVTSAVSTHEGAADPHAGYQKESEKAVANGYASLGATGLVPIGQLATGTPDGKKFVRDDGTLALPIASGTTNPATPASGDLFFRTDRDLLITYDGTRWVTANLYREPFGAGGTFSVSTAAGRIAPWSTTYDMWLETAHITCLVNTTNNATNYWTLSTRKFTAANAATTIGTAVNTSADAATTWAMKTIAINALLDPATYVVIDFLVALTGSPGSIQFGANLSYRLVVP